MQVDRKLALDDAVPGIQEAMKHLLSFHVILSTRHAFHIPVKRLAVKLYTFIMFFFLFSTFLKCHIQIEVTQVCHYCIMSFISVSIDQSV